MRTPTEKLYSKTDLAEHFGMPESTIRFYCERFAPYLEHKGQGRKRRYTPACLEVIDFIRTSMPNLRTSREMDKALAERFPVVAEVPVKAKKSPAPQPASTSNSTNAAAMQILERQTKALERIAANLEKLEQQPAPTAVSATESAPTLETLEALEALRAEIRDLRVLVKTTEKTQQEDMEQVRGLIMRLAKGK